MNNNKGITLIALVITVIALLILAGTAISLSLGQDSLFEKTNSSVKKWNAKVENENIVLTDYIKYLEEMGREPEKDWIMALVFRGIYNEYGEQQWFTPYFKDKELAEEFGYNNNKFSGEYEGVKHEYTLDPEFTFTSEEDIELEQAKGSVVFKLYSDGELRISGTDGLPENRIYASSLWGYLFMPNVIDEDEAFYDIFYTARDVLFEELTERISKVVICEGIKHIDIGYFGDSTPCANATSFEFPSTIEDIDSQAFYYNGWIRILDSERGYWNSQMETEFVDVEINGKNYSLVVYY
ncbi:MAG: hypothetical protein IKP28_03975 [Clostridia bacterium]|nr:hypothetical protein [Clostridia bacterium]